MLDITKDLTVLGGYPVNAGVPDFTDANRDPQANPTILDANSSNRTTTDRVLTIRSGNTVTVDGLSLQGGSGTGPGGGIYNEGTLTISNSIISGNQANQDGGGIFNSGGNLTISNSTISGNQANPQGGGIINLNGSLTISNSIISGNQAEVGGGIDNENFIGLTSSLTISNSTISGNQAEVGGGITNTSDGTTISNSIVYNNAAPTGADISNIAANLEIRHSLYAALFNFGTLTASDDNITSIPASAADDVFWSALDPTSAPSTAGDFRLELRSPAVNTGDASLLPDESTLGPGGTPLDIDGDGLDNPIDVDLLGNPRQVMQLDMGAYERQALCYVEGQTPVGIITDANNTLQNAVNAVSTGTIRIAGMCVAADDFSAENMIEVTGTKDITLRGGYPVDEDTPDFSAPQDPTANQTLLDANGRARGLLVEGSNARVVFDGIDVQGGNANFDGGGISVVRDADLTVSRSHIHDNEAANGGGIHIFDATATIERSTISGNLARSNGGGVSANTGISGGTIDVSITNSTISGNTANSGGGGVATAGSSAGAVRMNFVTLVDNVGGGSNGDSIDAVSSVPVEFVNGIATGNPPCSGSITQIGGSFFERSSVNPFICNGTIDADLSVGTGLSPLQDNGGPTPTHALLNTNPSSDGNPVGAGAFTNATYSTPATDQRGVARPQGAAVDAGAFELEAAAGGTGLNVTGFNAMPDHVLGGRTTLTIQVEWHDGVRAQRAAPQQDNSGMIQILYSPDAICSADDTQIAEIPVTSETITTDVQIPRDLLAQQAASSQDIGYLCALTPADLDGANSIDAASGKLIVADDITYFPYDSDGNGVVTPSDAMSAINALGIPNSLHDVDGNGVVTPSEAVNVLLMLGASRDNSTIETDTVGTAFLPSALNAADAENRVPTNNLPVAGREAAASITLTITELDSTPGIVTGEQFNLNVYTADSSNVPLFAGYVDLQFDPAALSAEGIRYGEGYRLLQRGTIDNAAGFVNGLGATNGGFTPSGDGLLAIIRMTALRDGLSLVKTSAAQPRIAQTVRYGDALDMRHSVQQASISVGIQLPVAPSAPLPVQTERGQSQPSSIMPIAPVNPQPTPTPLPALPVGGR